MSLEKRTVKLSKEIKIIFDSLPDETWKSPTATFLDPAMAGGQFIKEIVARLRAAGHSDDNIKSRVFGFESSTLRVRAAVGRNNLIGTFSKGTVDSITGSFDYVMCNPLQVGFRKFLNQSLTLLSNNGTLIIIGENYLDPTFKSRSNIRTTLIENGLQNVLDFDSKIAYIITPLLSTNIHSLDVLLSEEDKLNEEIAKDLEEQANLYGGFETLGVEDTQHHIDGDQVVEALTITNEGPKFIKVPAHKTYLFLNSDKLLFTHRQFGKSSLSCYKPNVKSIYLYRGSQATTIHVGDEFSEDEFRAHFDNDDYRRALRYYLRGKSKLNNWIFSKFPKKSS